MGITDNSVATAEFAFSPRTGICSVHRQEEVAVALQVSGRHLSTDAAFSDAEDMNLMDVLFNPDEPQPDKGLMANSLSIEITRALATLTNRESDIVTLFYGIGFKHPLTLEEIGEKYDNPFPKPALLSLHLLPLYHRY